MSQATLRKTGHRRPGSPRSALRIVSSPDAGAIGRTFELDGSTYTFGREGEGAERIEDPTLSRKHVRVAKVEGAYVVRDLGGTNGTFVDGVRIGAAGEPLAGHSVISAGDTLIVTDDEPDPDLMPAIASMDGEHLTELAGISLVAQRMRKSIATIAAAKGSVLLLGPTGAGKEVAARALHRASGRAGAFVPVNCATIPAELAESSLFGHVKGAFTGAINDHDGFFLQANGGTLFLDEVGDLPLPLQPKLLRVLEDSTVVPVGGKGGRKVEVRVVAATHRELGDEAFRRDLYARIGTWVLRLPPLRERRADVLHLFERFLGRTIEMPSELREALLLHDWPMNVRELSNLATRIAGLVGAHHEAGLELLPAVMQEPILNRFDDEPEQPEAGTTRAPDRETLLQAITASEGNVALAAQRNGWHRTQLYRWLRRAGIDAGDFRR